MTNLKEQFWTTAIAGAIVLGFWALVMWPVWGLTKLLFESFTMTYCQFYWVTVLVALLANWLRGKA